MRVNPEASLPVTVDARVCNQRTTPRHLRIIERAVEYMSANIDRPIYTDDLCDALGVSASALAEAFRAVLTVSPHRFLKLRRLAMVRAALMDRTKDRLLIKTIALSHGFWHLGQFAHDYRTVFGEIPSETVARIHGTSCCTGTQDCCDIPSDDLCRAAEVAGHLPGNPATGPEPATGPTHPDEP